MRKQLADSTTHADLERVRIQMEDAQKKCNDLATSRDQLQEELAERDSQIEAIQNTADQHEGDLAAAQRRIERAMQKDGQTWIERVRADAPEFQAARPRGSSHADPLGAQPERRRRQDDHHGQPGGCPRCSRLARLLIDLDLQGSLSGLFLSDAQMVQSNKDRRLLNHFLEASFDAEYPRLPEYVHPILSGDSGLVPASDDLFYAESNLTLRKWQLRDNNRDPRFLLRKELLFKRITNDYDIVLMDCPPVFNVCCVNALAASDYVLAPILASKQSTIRVPALLKRLKGFGTDMHSDLHVMGIVANRTLRSDLTVDEENRLTALADISRDVYGTTCRSSRASSETAPRSAPLKTSTGH